jgi:DNA-binding winged helix-turn-helix (wHTH) protein
VYRAWDEIGLTATEFELLRYLMRHPRRAVRRDEILHHVWKYDFGDKSSIVDLYISYLRKKIDTGREPLIHTVRGVGYMLRPASDPTIATRDLRHRRTAPVIRPQMRELSQGAIASCLSSSPSPP